MSTTYITGCMLVGIGFVSAIIVSILDKAGAQQLGMSDEIKAQSKRVVSHLYLLLLDFVHPLCV